MILEGVLTTINADRSVNIAPMGPIVDDSIERLILRPFQTSTTYANLKRTGHGVFHVTDDVLLIAKAAVGAVDPVPPMVRWTNGEGVILTDACRWYALRITSVDDRQPRTEMNADVVDSGRQRDFFGFNRARHAVLEAAILATRVDLLPLDEIAAEFARLAVPVEKTGGPAERTAFEYLQQFIHNGRVAEA